MNNTQTIARDTSVTAAGSTSTLWIAERTEKQHAHVMRDVRTLCAELEMPEGDVSNFGAIYLDSMNRQQDCYLLPFDIAHVLMIRYSAALGMVIVKEWKDLHEGRMQPKGEAHTNSLGQRLLGGTRQEKAARYARDMEGVHMVKNHGMRRMYKSFAGMGID